MFSQSFRILAFTLALGPLAASAQSTQDDEFCSFASLDLLSALDGNWTFKQHAGFAFAASMVIPLPPHPGQTFNITYDSENMVAIMSGEGQQMALVPTAPETVQSALQFINEAEAEGLLQIGAACDFYDLPLVLGSNSYSLVRNPIADEPGYTMEFFFDGNIETVCVRQADYEADFGEPQWDEEEGIYQELSSNRTPFGLVEVYLENDEQCTMMANEMPSLSPGDLVMSLAVKFQTLNSGTGLLYFEGIKDGYRFAAKAPVTLSR